MRACRPSPVELEEPYVGPRAFERRDQQRFFGRNWEASQLLARIIAHPVVLLYARSGAGKSSLLNAKLVPMLKQEGCHVFPTVRVRPVSMETANLGDDTNFYVYNALHCLEPEADAKDFRQATLDRYLLDWPPPAGAGEPLPKVLILDQFEEMFTVGDDWWQDREPFMEQLGFALQEDTLLRVVLAMREDHIAKLDPYAALLPDGLRVRFRTELLREEAALAAVRGPLELNETGPQFAPGVAEKLVSNLLKMRDGQDSTIRQGEFVEPFQLQVVCQSLWRSIRVLDVHEISDEHLARFGDVQQVLAQFYDKAVQRVAEGSGLREGRVRHWFEEKLITPRSTRAPVLRYLKETAGIPNAVVDKLEKERLLVSEERGGDQWYELAHERLIDAVQEANKRWRSRLTTSAIRKAAFVGLTLAAVFVVLLVSLWAKVLYLQRIGEMELRLGGAEAARASLLESFLLARRLNWQRAETDSALMAGLASFDAGLIEPAFDLNSTSLENAKQAGDRSRIAAAMVGIGEILLGLGSAEAALDYLDPSELAEIEDEFGKSRLLFQRGRALEILGRTGEAIRDYESSLALLRGKRKRHWGAQARRLTALGRIALRQQRTGEARRRLTEALDLSEWAGDRRARAEALRELGDLYRIAGEPARALGAFAEAVALSRELGRPWDQIETLRRKSAAELDMGRLAEALDSARRTIDLGDRLRVGVQRLDLRRQLATWLEEDYDLLLDVLVQNYERDRSGPFLAEAFAASERSRAPILSYLLAIDRSAGAASGERGDPELARQWQELQSRIESAVGGSGGPDLGDSRAQALARLELDSLLRELWKVEAKIRQVGHPQGGADSPSPLGLNKVQDELLDDGTVLLEYDLGNRASYLFLVSSDRAEVFRLPKAPVLEKSARTFLEAIAAHDEATASTKSTGADLARQILTPVADRLRGQRLLIIPDGVLHSVPFAALPDPTLTDPGEGEPLIVRHEIAYSPSATVSALLEGRLRRRPQGRGIVILADPVLSYRDPRLPKELRGKRPAGRSRVPPLLPGTRLEAEAISRLLPSGSLLRAVGFDASRELLLGPTLADSYILHLATYTRIDTKRPELSSIFLSNFDRRGWPRDGLVRAYELLSVRLPVDLAVLSGGRTLSIADAEGLGLGQAFFAAGAGTLIGSLWNVEDRSTAELMGLFYRRLLYEGLPPAAALRQAQLELSTSKDRSAPYFWAGFRVEGGMEQ